MILYENWLERVHAVFMTRLGKKVTRPMNPFLLPRTSTKPLLTNNDQRFVYSHDCESGEGR